MLVHRLRRWPNIEPTLVQCILLYQCWSTVYDCGPTLNQHRYYVSCFQTRFKPNEMLVKLVKYGMVGRCLVNEIIIGFKDVYVSSFAAGNYVGNSCFKLMKTTKCQLSMVIANLENLFLVDYFDEPWIQLDLFLFRLTVYEHYKCCKLCSAWIDF